MMNELKQQYNALLLRHCKAEKYLANTAVPIHEREQWLPNYKFLVNQLESILEQLQQMGIEATAHEILNGFYIEEA